MPSGTSISEDDGREQEVAPERVEEALAELGSTGRAVPGTSRCRSRRTGCCRRCPAPNSSPRSSAAGCAENATIAKTGSTRNQALLLTVFMAPLRSAARRRRDGRRHRCGAARIEGERRLAAVDGDTSSGDACREGLAAELDPGDARPPDIVDAPHLHRKARSPSAAAARIPAGCRARCAGRAAEAG